MLKYIILINYYLQFMKRLLQYWIQGLFLLDLEDVSYNFISALQLISLL